MRVRFESFVNFGPVRVLYNKRLRDTILSGFWPDGVALIGMSDNCLDKEKRYINVVSVVDGRALLANGETTREWLYWIVTDECSSDGNWLTNFEIATLCRNGWTVCIDGTLYSAHTYRECADDESPADTQNVRMRAPGSRTWLVPTKSLLKGASV